MDEIELMQRVGGGEQAAIEQLVDRHYASIYRLARHLIGNREDAEDITQDVFLRARARGKSFQGNGSVRTWLTRVAINECSRHCRRAKLRSKWPWHATAKASGADEMIDSEWLLAGLAQLRVEHRVALLLFEVQGFSVKEISEATRSPEGTVKARLHYARIRLRQLLVCPEETDQ